MSSDEAGRNFRDDMAVFVEDHVIPPSGYGVWYYDWSRRGAWYLPVPMNYVAAFVRWLYLAIAYRFPFVRWANDQHTQLMQENARLKSELENKEYWLRITREQNRYINEELSKRLERAEAAMFRAGVLKDKPQ